MAPLVLFMDVTYLIRYCKAYKNRSKITKKNCKRVHIYCKVARKENVDCCALITFAFFSLSPLGINLLTTNVSII